MNGHFNIRVFVQMCLTEAWKQAEYYHLQDVMEKYVLVKNMIDFTMADG